MQEIHAQPAECILLESVCRVEKPHVEDHVARLGTERMLEAEPQPGVAFVPAGIGPRRGSVGEGEEPGAVAAGGIQSFEEETVLMVEHLLDPLTGDVALCLAVDRIAEGHVVGRHRLRDGACRAADGEEPASHLLPGTDLGERTINL